jgi:hypothetical protein
MKRSNEHQRDNVAADASASGEMFDDLTLSSSDHERLQTLERTIEKGLPAFTAVGKALLQIREEKLYRLQYKSFEEYCRDRWALEHSHAYELMRSAEVSKNLETSAIAEVLPTREYQIRALTSLSPEQQIRAWTQAVAETGKGKAPTGDLVRKVVARMKAHRRKERRQLKLAEGWTEEELKDDTALSAALDLIQNAYGEEETDLIKKGIIQLARADLLFLGKQTPAVLNDIHELVVGKRWTPQDAVKFLGTTPDKDTTVEDLQNYALATKAKYFKAVISRFEVTCRWLRPASRLETKAVDTG